MPTPALRVGALLLAAGLAAACSGGDETRGDETGGDGVATSGTAAPATTAESGRATTSTSTTLPERDDGPLADVCPATIVVQTDDLPSVEHGPLYRLLDPATATADPGAGVVAGPLVRADGTVEDVTLELRAGGPATAFRPTLELLADDDSITLAQASTPDQLLHVDDQPTLAVAALTDASHEAIVWDPRSHPDLVGLADVGAAGVAVHHFTDSPFVAYLLHSGVLTADQLVAGHDGEPAAFVAAGGAIAVEGDALVEPVLYPALPQWGAPVAFGLGAEVGWVSYDDTLVVPAGRVDELADCLGRLVPVVQEAIAAYVAEAAPTNTFMAEQRLLQNPLNRLGAPLLDQASALAVEAGIFGGGTDGTIGDVELARLDAFLPTLADALGIDPVAADDLADDAFVDPTVTTASGG